MTATIWVWDAFTGDSTVGHASLSISSPKAYISWWPAKVKTSLLIQEANPIKLQRISADLEAEARQPDFSSAPIEGLDEKKILTYWEGLSGYKVDFGPGASFSEGRIQRPDKKVDKYNLYTRNCASVVLDALKAGGLYEVYPIAANFCSGAVVEPSDIKKLANLVTNYKGGKITKFSFCEHFQSHTMAKY